ncbi:hypothetical protein K443DRAFT_384784 [Laccaria amethystina LaAM-08-1]|uniref:Uncharacterized protein n=1 Tax=Laccaria amethystina LaAM-08-1 TaxID=1095629 RepID=A0A0C9XAV9_9AGAR|nr:hypothetical protein K443DRAFT_384784 [Laccaria amethystina LaAM-08-1]
MLYSAVLLIHHGSKPGHPTHRQGKDLHNFTPSLFRLRFGLTSSREDLSRLWNRLVRS